MIIGRTARVLLVWAIAIVGVSSRDLRSSATVRTPAPKYVDYNGDGFADLAIGAPFESVGEVSDAGAVHVFYGSSFGVQAAQPDDQLWTQDSPGVRDVAESGDEFGYSLSSGDFNGDGFYDLAVDVHLEGVGDAEQSGAVQVLYGSSSGLQSESPDDQFWTQDSPGVKDRADRVESFGLSLAAADLNADGFADLATGVPGEFVRGLAGAGAVSVLYGSARGLQANSPDDQLWSQDSAGVKESSEAYEDFGFALASGDFNADGFADLAIGVPDESVGQVQGAGAATVLYGSSRGLQATSPDDQFWSQDSPGVEEEAEGGDAMGSSFAVDDFNGDGYEDLATGTPLETIREVSDAGALNVLYGSPEGLQAFSPPDQLWSQDSPEVEDEAANYEQFGFSLAGGDFNGDGFGDLAVGVPKEDFQPVLLYSYGGANVLYGSARGLQTSSPLDQFWNQSSPGFQDEPDPDDFFGWSVTSADYNEDGFVDLAIGVPLEDLDSPNGGDAGAAHVLYGGNKGLQVNSPRAQFWSQNSPGVKGSAGGGFGWALS